MNYVYPAVFYEEEGKISVVFPDFGNLAAFGNDIADAMRMAQDACGLYLFITLRDGEKLPVPTALNDVDIIAILKDFGMESAIDNAFANIKDFKYSYAAQYSL